MGTAALLVFALLLPQDDVQARVSLSDDRISVGATTMLQVTVQTSGGRPESIELPSLPPALDVLSSRESQQTQLSLPGGRTSVVRRDIVLRARAEGLYTIDPIVIRLPGGTVRHTRPLTLRVVAGQQSIPLPPGVRRPSAGGLAEAGTLQVSVTPDTAWLGEPVLLRMRAHIPEEQRTRRGRSPTFDPPVAVGFWVQEVEDRGAVGVRRVGSHYYDTHEYRRFYVPLMAGVHALSPGRVLYDVDRGWMFAPQSHELRSDSIRVHVRSLPDEGQPSSFTGAVGRFSVRAGVDRTDLADGDAATLTVEVSGVGNIKALPAPALPEMPGLAVYEPSEDATFTAQTSGIEGTKRFHWILTPAAPGTYPLPDLRYAWFDPDGAHYDSMTIELPTIRVGGIVAQASEADTALAPPRLRPAGAPSFTWARSSGFALLQLIPLTLIAIAYAWRREVPRLRAYRARRRDMRADFTSVRAQAERDPRAALSALQQTLDAALDAMREPGVDVESALRTRGAGSNVLASLHSLRSAIRTMRFRPEPVGAADVEALVRRAEALTDRVARASRARRAAAVAVILPLVALTGSAGAVQEQAFADGVAALERGDYRVARGAFVAHLAAWPHDAAGWYNLGNTDYLREARGPAVHAWARALRIEPRADDARRNLRIAGADDVAAAAGETLPLTSNELLGWAGILWLVGGTLLALRVLTGRRSGRSVGVAAVAMISIAGAALVVFAARATVDAQGIVVRAGELRAGPGLHAETRAVLGGGALLRIEGAHDEWLHVRRGTDEGWIESRDVGRLE